MYIFKSVYAASLPPPNTSLVQTLIDLTAHSASQTEIFCQYILILQANGAGTRAPQFPQIPLQVSV